MASRSDVRRIALSLPGTEEAKDHFAFSVMNKGKAKGFAWVWRERTDPKKPRVPNHGVLAVRVANNAQKDLMLSLDTRRFFTEPHYNGYPAVLVRLKEITVADLRVLLEEAWRCQAPKALREPSKPAKVPAIPRATRKVARGARKTSKGQRGVKDR